MTKEVGIDIVEIKRIKLSQEFIDKVLSDDEIALYNTFDNKKRRKEFVAGRWAAKEALIKATNSHIIPNQINIGYKNKRPYITNKEFEDFRLSIAHENKNAIAIVINESKNK